MLLPVLEWLPDQFDLANPGSSNIHNVVSKTQQSFGGFPAMGAALSPLTARCQGAIGVRDSAANTYNFSGDATKLYSATSAGSSWTDVSGTAYTIAAEEQWRFVQFQDLLLALNISDPIQAFTLNSSSAFANLAAAAPKARYGCVSKGFLLLGNTAGGTADGSGPGSCPQRVWWPKIGDPTNWPTLGTSAAAGFQSDAQDLVDAKGWITGMVSNVGAADALVFAEGSVHRAMYIAGGPIWGFYAAVGARGCAVPGSIQRTEQGVIYLGPDGIYITDGQNFTDISNQKCSKTFYADLDQTYLARICSALDPINKLYFLAYPSLNGGNGVLDRMLVCNYGLQSVVGTPGRWTRVYFGTSGGVYGLPVNGNPGEYLFISTSFGYNVDNFTANTGFTVDSAPAGPDSRLWTGNKDIISMFDTMHMLNYFTGNNIAAIVETGEQQLIPGQRANVSGVRPICDGGSPTVTPFIRNRVQDDDDERTASTIDAGGYCWFTDAEGFYHRFRIALDAGTDFSHLQGLDVPDEFISATGII